MSNGILILIILLSYKPSFYLLLENTFGAPSTKIFLLFSSFYQNILIQTQAEIFFEHQTYFFKDISWDPLGKPKKIVFFSDTATKVLPPPPGGKKEDFFFF